MGDLSTNVIADDGSSSNTLLIEQSNLKSNISINGTSSSMPTAFGISYETTRILFIVLAILTVFVCLIICVFVCIRICPKRRRKSKGQDNKETLLADQSSVPSATRSSKLTNNPIGSNGKQGSSLQQMNTNSVKPTTKPFYYDNLDDIPFIDESRPTSVVDIAQV